MQEIESLLLIQCLEIQELDLKSTHVAHTAV